MARAGFREIIGVCRIPGQQGEKAHLAGALHNAGHDEDADEGGDHAAEAKHERELRVQQMREAERERGGRGREQNLPRQHNRLNHANLSHPAAVLILGFKEWKNTIQVWLMISP